MGACNPKRQIQQEKLIMFSLMNTVITQLTTAQSDGSKSDIEAALEPLRDFEVYFTYYWKWHFKKLLPAHF